MQLQDVITCATFGGDRLRGFAPSAQAEAERCAQTGPTAAYQHAQPGTSVIAD